MPAAATQHEVKRIDETGQVSVGKALAGKLVRVEPRPEGVLLRFVEAVPEKDVWWLKEPHETDLKRALEWAATHPASETDLDELFARTMAHAKQKQKAKPPAAKTPKTPARTRQASKTAPKRQAGSASRRRPAPSPT